MSIAASIERPVGFGPFLRLPLFEGPLDLLLHLCRRQELPVSEVALSAVTGQFLAYLDLLGELELDVAGEFVETAALLCLLKSRELLPAVVLADEDAAPEEDPRAALLQRLLDAKRYREAAREIARRPRRDRDYFLRPRERSEDGEGPLDCDLVDLLGALRDLLDRARRQQTVHEVAPAPLPLAERMAAVLALVRARGSAALSDLLPTHPLRAVVVVTFLAILHLAMDGLLRLTQPDGGSILLEAA